MTTRYHTLGISLTAAMLILITACTAPATLPPAPTLPPPATAAPATLSGHIAYQAPQSPASVVYAVNVADPQKWTMAELPAADVPLSFSLQVPAGTYQLVAHTQKGTMTSALLTADETLGTVTVAAGQTIADLSLRMTAPQVPCQFTRVPASPDGRFPAIEPVSSCPALTQEAASTIQAATLSGHIAYQAPQSPASVVYAVNVADPQKWTMAELPAADVPLSFSLQVPVGTYQLIAHTQNGTMTSALLTADETLGTVTVAAGQTIADLSLRMTAPQVPCQFTRVPASPDGRFPAIEPVSSCGALMPEATPAAGAPMQPASMSFDYTCESGTATTTFAWVDSSNNEDGFRLYRNGTPAANLPANSTSYMDRAPIASGETLQYRLVAYNSAGESGSRSASVICP